MRKGGYILIEELIEHMNIFSKAEMFYIHNNYVKYFDYCKFCKKIVIKNTHILLDNYGVNSIEDVCTELDKSFQYIDSGTGVELDLEYFCDGRCERC